MNNTVFKRAMSLLLCLVMVFGLLPTVALTTNAATTDLFLSDSKKADPSTIDWEKYFGANKMDTEFAGMVWSDKSVFTDASDLLPGIALKDSDNFLIALSTMASNMTITGHTASPTDTMLVLDLSGSMVDDTYEVGTTRRGNNNYDTVEGIDTSIIEALVDSTNAVITSLMEQNANNRVGVVLYSGNTSTNQAATSGSATVVLPLGRYTAVEGEYLSLSAPTTTADLYEWVRSGWGNSGYWQATGETATYVPENASIVVSVKEGLKTEADANVASASKTVVGGTYIQNGLYKAMNEFLSVSDTTVPEGSPQAGAERTPVLVLMSDGAPTIATTDYMSIGNSDTGNGGSTNDRITFLTQLTAAYVRGKVAEKYQENDNDEKDILFLTLGLGTENSTEATNTLLPSGSGATLSGYWTNYLAADHGNNVDVIEGEGNLTVERSDAVAAMNYVDKYFYASNAQGLIDSFDDIISEIELKAASYATLVTGGNADLSGYVTFEDELGELMEVTDIKGILLGSSHFSGMEIAKDMNTGVLGTPGASTELGDEFIATVKERIPGTTTTQAQQLVSSAYNDRQLYYESDSNWSNYIGWYADADGNYAGFWDKDSGYENAPADAVYANKSYGYLGVNGDSNMMHVVVLVRTNLQTLHQTVFFKVPAALLPTVTYKITLAENDPATVKEFIRTGADPIQLVFEAGLRSDINAVNLEAKVAEHIANGGHVHRNADGSIELYTNSWSIGNDLNGNGIPDPEEQDSAVVAEAHFHPALENSRYYFTEDALVLDASGNPVTGDTQPSGTGYHHDYYIYNATGRTTVDRALSAATLQKAQKNADGQWYIPAGTVYRELPRMRNYKTENTTDTLDYSDYPAVFADANVDVYNFLGNNGTVTIAPATGITLTKQVEGTIDGVSQYTFQVTLSGIPAGIAAAPVITDSNGDALANVTMSEMVNNSFTVTMPADVTAYISGIPAGTTVTVAEQIDGDYKITDIKVSGVGQAVDAPAAATVPAYSATGTQMVPVVFTNAANGYGDLVITKDVTHGLASDPDALAGKAFTFQVKLTGNKIVSGQTFPTSAGKDVKVAADGTVTYADGSAIILHNEESITIYNIPEHSTYTVTELSIPGFTLDSVNGDQAATQASGVITSTSEAVAAFINRYPNTFTPVEVPVVLDVTKVLNALSPYTGSEEFVFVLQMLLADGTYPNIADDNGQEYLKVGANSSKEGAFTLTFDDLGTYYLRIVELKPSEQDPAGINTDGMNYSTTRALFEINVTDTDMDGVLEIAVREEDHVTVSTTYTDNDPEKISGVRVEAAFTNTFRLHSTYTTLNVHKVLNNTTGVDKHLTDFHFSLYPSDAQGNVAAGTEGQTVTTSALGDATFNLFLDTAGTFCYKVSEVIPTAAVLDAESGKYVLNGMYYDPAEYLFTVVTEANGENLVVTSRTLKDLATGADVADLTATFVNDYILTETDPVSIPLSKALTGRAPYDGERYQFYLVRTNDAFTAELTGAAAWNATYTLDANSSTVIEDLVFDQAGSYHYKLTEIVPEGAEPVSGSFAPGATVYELNGVTYDPAEYHITVTIADNGQGGLTATMVMHKLGQTDPVNTAAFTNVYNITGTGSVTIGGEKVLDGRAQVPGEFYIGLYTDAACETTPLALVQNQADGSFSFPTMEYTVADLDDNNAAKVYTYYVKEIAGTKGGVTYDPNVYTVTVIVSHEDGKLVVTPSANAATLQIRNTYAADKVDVTLHGSKVLVGDWSAVANKDFTFELYAADSGFRVTNTTPVDTETVTGNASFTFALSYEDGEEGFYYFVLREDTSADAGGVGYDAGEYHITVSISDPGNGQLVSQATMYRPGTGNIADDETLKAPVALFSNAYSVASTSITVEGTKTFTDVSKNERKPMTGGEFSFLVLEGDDVVSTGTNKADGTIDFEPITYTQAGNHAYTVIEDPGTAGGVIYDDASFTVTVTVTDNGDGTLTAAANYPKPVIFNNEYNPTSAQVTLNGIKNLTGDWSAVLSANKIFTFELYEADSAFNTIGAALDITTNETDGSFSFGTRTYTTEDTHYYVILERNGGEKINGITYDGTRINITVKVEDHDGTLIPTVTASHNAATITENSNHVTVDNLSFTNAYAASSAEYTPEAQKIYEAEDGEDMKAFDFELSGDGIETQTKQNDTVSGKVAFDTLYFSAAGSYELTIREQENILWGLIRWDRNIYTITLHVEDNGAGRLVVNEAKTQITSSNGRDDLVFRNAHHDVITDKDVFLVSEPSVSIDGKAVEKNDILLYKISYTNYAGVPVDITITDVIPQYTTYVDGSADNGGTLTGNTLSWSLEDVAPDATVTVSFKVKVADTNITVTNSAVVLEGENEYHTNAVTNPVKEDTFTKTVFHAAEPTVSIDGSKVEKNDILLYKITYTNTDDFAADVTITDTIPQYTAYVDGSADNGGTLSGNTLTWNLQLAAGETKTVSFQVKVTGGEGQAVTNQAAALEGENQLVTNQVTSSVTDDTVVKDVFHAAAPTVSIDGQPVEMGDILLYKVTYTNADDSEANVTITDMIPEHTTYVDGSADNGGTLSGSTLTWNLQLTAGESKTVSFQVKVTDTKVTVVNQASALEGENRIDTNIVRTPVEEDLVTKDVFLADDPSISIDGKAVEKGDVLVYKITYTNADGLAANVTITDTISQYTAYVAGSADNGGTEANGVITWNLQLAAGESKTVSFRVKVTGAKGETVANQAAALEGGNQVVTNQVSNPIEEDKVSKDVFREIAPAISIDGKTVESGDVLVYKITYTNADDFAASVTITDVISKYTTYMDGSADNGGVYADGVLTWNLQLAAGETRTVTFKATVNEAGVTVTNQASALEGENRHETEQVTNSSGEDTVTKDVFHAAEPTVSIDGKAVEKGDVLVYKITYTNADDFAADVIITDVISKYTAYVDGSADNGGTLSGNTLTWNLQLAAGESKTVSFRVKVTGVKGETVTNKATALEGENRCETEQVTNPIKEDTFVKDAFSAAAPTVSIDGKTVESGDVLLYKITYTNADDLAADVTITDVIPAHTAYVDGSADNGGTLAGNTLTWKLQLAAGESKTVSFKVTVIEAGVTVTNQATALEGENEWKTNTVTTDAPAIPDIPVTGDTFNPVLCCALILISGMALAAVVCSKKYLVK